MEYDVIIVGGSYAGLQAGMTLGRALKNVLIIDSGKPCNAQTPHSHNFLTRDGETPAAIAQVAQEQLKAYPTVQTLHGVALTGTKTATGFTITTSAGDTFAARRLLFATGIKDTMPPIPGVAECWGISVIHCPYCHGYEVRDQPTGLLANGDTAFEMVKMLRNWTRDLTVFTNGQVEMTDDMVSQILERNITIIDTPLKAVIHNNGHLHAAELEDGRSVPVKAVYARLPFTQHCDIPAQLGCEINEMGFIKIAEMGKTTVEGVYAAGDNCTMLRSVGNAVAAGMAAAAFISRELNFEDF
jgi:thioredoxin reductase